MSNCMNGACGIGARGIDVDPLRKPLGTELPAASTSAPYFGLRKETALYARPFSWFETKAESNDIAWMRAVFKQVNGYMDKDLAGFDAVVFREYRDTMLSAEVARVLFEAWLRGKRLYRIDGNACRGIRLVDMTNNLFPGDILSDAESKQRTEGGEL